jgi:DNA adenine methylase
MGSLSVALGLQPDRALLNDANIHLANLYHHLQQGLAVTIEMKNDREFYYEMRSRFNQLTTTGKSQTSEAAQIFYYLNRTAFNGLCRFNNSGGFNVPFGRYKTINYLTDFSAYQIPLQAWEIGCGDFEQLELKPDDFIYADPPYDVQFTKYSQADFTWNDQIRLTQWLAQHPGKVVLSNQATDRIVDLYRNHGFTIKIVDAPRRISCNGDRQPAKEVIACKGF